MIRGRWAAVVMGIAMLSPSIRGVGERDAAYSAGLAVQVGADELLAAALPERPLVEPHLAANPRNAQHLVGGAIVSVRSKADLMQNRCVALATFDGARTWLAHEFDVPRCYDPWAAILDDGTAVFVALETDNSGAVPHLWLFRSLDGGRTWSAPPHSFGRAHDHPTLVVDRSGGRYHGALYVASLRVVRDTAGRHRTKQFIARSHDGGKTFEPISEHETTNLVSNTLTVAVLPDGGLLMPVRTFARYVSAAETAPLQRLDWMIRSEDGGARFGPPMLITERCASGGVGFPSLAVDLSQGPYRGRAYFICFDGTSSGPYVVRSEDGGDRWSDPVHVAQRPSNGTSAQGGLGIIAVNRDGVLAVSWHQRGPESSGDCWNVLVAFSGDGGETFSDATKVSTSPSCPSAGNNGYASEAFPYGGHYSGLAAGADGTFRLLWADSRGERYELRTAQVQVTR